MSVKKERPDPSVYPPPPPLLQQGLRPNMLPMYGSQQSFLPGQLPPGCILPRPPALQASPGTMGGPATVSGASNSDCPPPRPPAEQSMSENDLNKRIDKASIKGTFGWETIDDANIPCIFRSGEKFVSVRMVEQKLLSKYPSTYPDELKDRPPLMSQFITQPESRLLNEINIEHCACEYGQRSFTEKDLVVSLKDFISFYQIVRKHFPNEKLIGEKTVSVSSPGASGGGWVQVNNTVVPYLRRLSPTKEILNLAPLPVIKYAAGLLTDSEVPALEPTDDECKLLSDMCKSAGLDFNFSHNTPLILLQQLPVYCSTKVLIKRLPDDDPFGNAEYCPEFDMDDSKAAPPSHGGVMLPTMQDLSPQSYSTRPVEGHSYVTVPPNVTVQPGAFSQIPKSAPKFIQPGTRPDTGAQSLQALEKIAGPPRKKSRLSNSTSDSKGSTPNGTPRASPNHVPRVSPKLTPQVSPNHPIPNMVNQGMPPRPAFQPPPGFETGLIPFMRPGSGMGVMAPPGAPQIMWPPATTNPADMQKLAEIMNMQAAILSGPIPAPTSQPCQRPTLPKTASEPISHPAIYPARTKGIPTSTKAAVPSVAQKPPPIKPKPSSKSDTERIQPVDFHGKKISCLVKGNGNERYALIEAISRVYFPHCSLEEFIKVIVNVLKLHIYQLDRDEEKSFISFYGLPTSTLKCNKVLKLSDLDRLMPQLKYMFKAKESASKDPSAPKSNPSSNKEGPVSDTERMIQDGNNNGDSQGTGPSEETHGLNLSMPPTNPFAGNAKKTAGGAQSTASKASSKKLEDAVNRLRQNKMMQMESGPVPEAVNQLGQGQVPRNPFVASGDI